MPTSSGSDSPMFFWRKREAFAFAAMLFGVTWVLGDAGAAEPQSRAAFDFPVASKAQLVGNHNKTRLIVAFNQKFDVRAFTLANPYRVVIDMPLAAFQLPSQAGEKGRGLIKAFRFGQVMQDGSRMVIDLAQPARIEKALVLDSAKDQPARLVLDLALVDRDVFMRTIALENRAPDLTWRQEPQANSADGRPLVVIDPGHGGIDNGTKASSGQMEKTLVLEFALLLRDQIEKAGKYRVAMTRSDDTFVPLADRVNFARSHHASLLISIHADALARREGDAQGATIYTLSQTASHSAAARLAETENRADVIAGVDLTTKPDDAADVLIDLARRETQTSSVQFARLIAGEMRKVARLHKDPLKSAGFRVLKAPDIPSVLVELGYVSNGGDLKSLTSQAWRERTADAIKQAVDQFFTTAAGRIAGPH